MRSSLRKGKERASQHKLINLPVSPWVTLHKYQSPQGFNQLSWVSGSKCSCLLLHNVTRMKTKLPELVVWLDGIHLKVHASHARLCTPLSTAVQHAGMSHTPEGLWPPESEEDMEQRRLLATLEPWSMLGWKPACRLACLVRWSLLMKHFSHMGQLKRFSPVCVR